MYTIATNIKATTREANALLFTMLSMPLNIELIGSIP